MKKIAIAAAVAATLASAEAAPFNGFSLGGNVGAAFTKYKPTVINAGNVNVTSNGFTGNVSDLFRQAVTARLMTQAQADAFLEKIQDEIDSFTGSKTNFAADIYAGYTKSFANNLFAGLDIGFNFENLSGLGKSGNVFGFSAAPRFGYKFNETTGAYVKVAVGSQFMSKDLKKLLKSSAFFITPALGVEKAFGNMSVRGEAGYKIQKLKVGTLSYAGTNVTVNNASVKKNAFIVTVGASYNF